MKLRLFTLFLLGTFILSCSNEPDNPAVTHDVADLKIPPRKENPIEFWNKRSLQIMAGKEGFLRSNHTIKSSDPQQIPLPIKVTRKDNKILKLVVGEYDETGAISGRTDYYFDNEKLAYVKGRNYKVYIHNDSIYLWLDENDKKLNKDEKTRQSLLDSLKIRVNEVMNKVGLKFDYEGSD